MTKWSVLIGQSFNPDDRDDIEYSGGGCALNTMRVFQWLSGVPDDSMFLGGLGTDTSGNMLQSLVEKDGVRTSFARHTTLPTGNKSKGCPF